jgi:hypothetical protein
VQEFEMDIYVFEMDKIKRQIKQLQEHLKWYKNWDNDDKNDCESGSSNNNYW